MNNDPPEVVAERMLRIQLTKWACAYEFFDVALVSDGHFDEKCYEVNLFQKTGRSDLDKWWKENFNPHTGSWIHDHPELESHVKPLTQAIINGNMGEYKPKMSRGRRDELRQRAIDYETARGLG